MLTKRKDLQQENKKLFIFLCIKIMRTMIFYVGLNFTLKNVTKLRHCWKARNNQLLVKLGWALQGCANLPKNVHSNATCLQHMHSVSYFTSFSSCMYPFFPLNLNLAKCLQKKKKKPKKKQKNAYKQNLCKQQKARSLWQLLWYSHM